MNVIRQGKRGGHNPSGSFRPAGPARPASRGRDRGALDFDLIYYRPSQRGGGSSSSEGRTPSNLQMQMAIRSSAVHRASSSSTRPGTSSNNGSSSLSQFNAGQQRPGPSSSSSATPRFASTGPPITPRFFSTPKDSIIVSSTPRSTPMSSSVGGSDQNSHVILAVSEGRGHARGEVGIAAIDIKKPRLILCQLSDRQTYAHTLTKISVFNPAEPNKLYQLLERKFPHASMTKVQRYLFRDSEGLEKVLHLCLPEHSSCKLILQDKFYALAATAALLKYVEFIQNVIFAAHSLQVEYQGAHHGTIIDVKTATDLELLLNQHNNKTTKTLVALMDHCCTHGGRRLLRASLLHPPCSQPIITRRQDAVQELVQNQDMAQKIREVLRQLPDVEQLLALCMQTPSNIDGIQAMGTRISYMLMLKTSLETLPLLATALENAQSVLLGKARESLLDRRGEQMKIRISHILNEDVKATKGGKTAIFQKCFALKSGIDDLMDVSRKTYCELISDMHDHVLELKNTHSLPLKMDYSVTKGYHIQITIQKHHPIKKSDLHSVFVQVQQCKNYLTCTTEILIHANERIKQVSNDILTLSNTRLTVVLNDIREHISYLYKMCESIAEVDLILALAQTSCSHNYVRPKFGDILSLKASRHPILESIDTCEPIANDIDATSWQNLTIITGPNMSGKSIYIKQVLLLQIMAQVGCYVPAEEATFRIADRIFSHLNFNDSIENNASTLSLEMQEMQLLQSSITATSVVALDELCRGTSVEEGTALAWAFCEELSQLSAFVFVTTHFRELTKIASMYPCIKNVHLETLENENDENKRRLVYTHRLLPGSNPVEGYGIRLAESLSVPEDIVEMAKDFASKLKTTSAENLISFEGDEDYILALHYHKLKALARKEDLCTNDLILARTELREALKRAEQRKIAEMDFENAPTLPQKVAVGNEFIPPVDCSSPCVQNAIHGAVFKQGSSMTQSPAGLPTTKRNVFSGTPHCSSRISLGSSGESLEDFNQTNSMLSMTSCDSLSCTLGSPSSSHSNYSVETPRTVSRKSLKNSNHNYNSASSDQDLDPKVVLGSPVMSVIEKDPYTLELSSAYQTGTEKTSFQENFRGNPGDFFQPSNPFDFVCKAASDKVQSKLSQIEKPLNSIFNLTQFGKKREIDFNGDECSPVLGLKLDQKKLSSERSAGSSVLGKKRYSEFDEEVHSPILGSKAIRRVKKPNLTEKPECGPPPTSPQSEDALAQASGSGHPGTPRGNALQALMENYGSSDSE